MVDSLDRQRHSAAHLLALAVLKLRPAAKLGIGPVIADGFYYDFDLDRPLSPDELPTLEKIMRESIAANLPFEGRSVSPDEARAAMADQPYKLEIIAELPANEPISLYTSSELVDLCRGGHVVKTGEISPHFKLTGLAGAYWRGDEKRPQLQRVYGVLFASQQELLDHLNRIEAAKKRDHRQLGRDLDLFTFSSRVGAGLPLFTPRGTIVRERLIAFLNSLQAAAGYERITIPHLAKPALYQTSGHWDKFKDDLFHVTGKSGEPFVVKPMNCPHHNELYASRPRSYRDLPIRYAETTTVYRDEQTGELNGLTRVRAITQDDGHVYCRPQEIKNEVMTIYRLIKKVYTIFTMPLAVRLSLRDPENDSQYLGDARQWQQAQDALRQCLEDMTEPSSVGLGEAAFYGPKLDFLATDALGRSWQVATIQLDFVQPDRFGLEYTDRDGVLKRPVLIHRAVFGSIERFMAILIEHYAGDLPLWLAPVQIAVLPISAKLLSYAVVVADKLQAHGLRVWTDRADEPIGHKIRQSEISKYPIMLIVGEREERGRVVSVRTRLAGDQGVMTLDELLSSHNFDLPT